MRMLTVAATLLVAGCGERGGGAFTIPEIAPPSTYAFDIFVHNYDPIPYSVWVEWQEPGTGAWKGFQLYALPAAPSGSHRSRWAVTPVTPGVLYYLVLADEAGHTFIDRHLLGSLTTPSYFPTITSYFVQSSKLTKAL